eukprot:495444-Prorocentrum_minimum.AAC.3
MVKNAAYLFNLIETPGRWHRHTGLQPTQLKSQRSHDTSSKLRLTVSLSYDKTPAEPPRARAHTPKFT